MRTFPHDGEWPMVERGQGPFLYLQDGRAFLDFTAGGTEHAVLGWTHPDIVSAIEDQVKKITHVDIKFYAEQNALELADLLVEASRGRFGKVYYAGNSGSEACEAAMKLSYQLHLDAGNPGKRWIIGRKQSYHGMTSDALSFCDRPNLQIYTSFLPHFRTTIAEHNEYRHRHPEESAIDYSQRSAQCLEDKILELGAENVAAFIGETMQGGLVGAVPPSAGYWQAIRRVCDRHNVHLILDEVWCGNGASGRYFCCDWDDVTPDFLVMGKTLGAGYAPVSVVVMPERVGDALEKSPQRRLQHGSTYQSYTLGIAAALAAQRIVVSDGFLAQIEAKGAYLQQRLKDELGDHPFFKNVRGRGLRQALEVSCPRHDDFTVSVAEKVKEDNILINGKWHRFLFTPAYIVDTKQIDQVLDSFIKNFHIVARSWPKD